MGSEIVRIDGSGADPTVGTMGTSEILQHIEEAAFSNDWEPVVIRLPAHLVAIVWSGVIANRLTRTRIDGKPALRWTAATKDIDIVPVKGKPLIQVFADGVLVATADYRGRDPEVATAAT